MNFSKKKKGFLTIDLLVSVSIITAVVLSASLLTQKSLNVSRRALHNLQASYLLEEGAEAVRTIRDDTWDHFPDFNYNTPNGLEFVSGVWTISGSSSTIGNFTRTVTFYTVNRDGVTGDIVTSGGSYDTGTVLVKVEVSWNESGQSVVKDLQFYITDIF
jgi:Tfp pilus assembly protein PilV